MKLRVIGRGAHQGQGALDDRGHYWVAAIDGIEISKSRKRHCDKCCTRKIKVGILKWGP